MKSYIFPNTIQRIQYPKKQIIRVSCGDQYERHCAFPVIDGNPIEKLNCYIGRYISCLSHVSYCDGETVVNVIGKADGYSTYYDLKKIYDSGGISEFSFAGQKFEGYWVMQHMKFNNEEGTINKLGGEENVSWDVKKIQYSTVIFEPKVRLVGLEGHSSHGKKVEGMVFYFEEIEEINEKKDPIAQINLPLTDIDTLKKGLYKLQQLIAGSIEIWTKFGKQQLDDKNLLKDLGMNEKNVYWSYLLALKEYNDCYDIAQKFYFK